MDKETQFRNLLEANQDRIYRICCCYLRDGEERRDVYQEVLVQIWRNLHTYTGRSSLSTWVYRVTVNVCLGHLRVEQRRKLLFTEETGGAAPAELTDAAAGDPSRQKEHDVRQLYEYIAQLPPLDKALISLFLEEASTGEMAEILGISEGNVRVKLHLIKQNLKHLWEQTDHELA